MQYGIQHCNDWGRTQIEGILPKGPYLPCVSMADRALLAGYPRLIGVWTHEYTPYLALTDGWAIGRLLCGFLEKINHVIMVLHCTSLYMAMANRWSCWKREPVGAHISPSHGRAPANWLVDLIEIDNDWQKTAAGSHAFENLWPIRHKIYDTFEWKIGKLPIMHLVYFLLNST